MRAISGEVLPCVLEDPSSQHLEISLIASQELTYQSKAKEVTHHFTTDSISHDQATITVNTNRGSPNVQHPGNKD